MNTLKSACLCTTLLLSACSTQLHELAAPMSVTELDRGVYRLENSVTIRATHADPVQLRAGTTWRQIGRIDQGNVFDTKDQVVIVNSFDVHEAALVTKDGYVVGFYAKASKTFVESKPVSITLVKGD